jgi:methyl-accepting chemotaxis protein
MFAARESQIQGLLPNFSANKEQLLQTNIDVFHKNPAHQRKILDALTGPLEDELPGSAHRKE